MRKQTTAGSPHPMRLGVEAALIEGRLFPGDLEVIDGRVSDYGLPSPGGRGIAAPGFVDLQVNGFAGVDFLGADADAYRRAGDALLEAGVTTYLPTFITAPEEELVSALASLPDSAGGPRVAGAHLEGPFLSPARLGMHPASARRDPDAALLERLLAAGPVRLVTLAPELTGADVLIDLLVERDVAVSFGHTDATAAEAQAGFERGGQAVTHIFNAMRPLGHHDPGIAGTALARDDVVVQAIFDRSHLASETMTLIWRAAGERLALVTDAIAAAAAGDGAYRVGGRPVEVRGGVARTPDGALAGSTLTMLHAVRNLHALGAPLEAALTAATAVPARLIGLQHGGRLGIGLPADLVVLDGSLELQRVVVGGRTLVG